MDDTARPKPPRKVSVISPAASAAAAAGGGGETVLPMRGRALGASVRTGPSVGSPHRMCPRFLRLHLAAGLPSAATGPLSEVAQAQAAKFDENLRVKRSQQRQQDIFVPFLRKYTY